jgi:hypothetical protein
MSYEFLATVKPWLNKKKIRTLNLSFPVKKIANQNNLKTI